MNNALPRSRWNFPLTLISLLLYLALLAWSQLHHELWGDEIHSWNIAKASSSFGDLFRNSRYEGHPPLWYILLWILSKFTHQPQSIQLLQYAIASFAIVLLLFRSPFPPLFRCILPFGYFLLYEYGTLSRNYALAVCLAFALLILIREEKAGNRWYYLLLFLLASTHLFGILLAISLHAYVVASYKNVVSAKTKWLHILMGALCVLPIFLFIIPPIDSELDQVFWMKMWNKRVFLIAAIAPLRSFFPLPAWWVPNFWNTHFLHQLAKQSILAKLIGYASSLGLLVLAYVVLKDDRNALRLFLLNTILITAIGLWFPLTGTRYTGFLFLGFIAALWLHKGVMQFSWKKNVLLYLLLCLQIPGSVVALTMDGKMIFSNASRTKTLAEKVPENSKLLSDYYALNPLITFLDRPIYCLEAKRELTCIRWTEELTRLAATSDPYKQGTD